MKNISASFTVALLVLCLPSFVYSQKAKSPVYKDGDWWKVKYEITGGSPGGSCQFDYSEYLVRIEEGEVKVYGFNGTSQEEYECNGVIGSVLGTEGTITKRLQFPLHVGKEWQKRVSRGRRRRSQRTKHKYKVLGWEKVQIPKGEFEAFKLSRLFATRDGNGRETYYYSPKVKAIVLLNGKRPSRDQVVTIVDFQVSN